MRRVHLSGSLYRLIYYSRNVLAETMTHAAMAAAVEALVTTARQRNAADHITGCLLCSASGFAHVLEGPREAVERTFDRIDADPRHADVMTISLMPIERLSFPDMPLAFAWQGDPGMPDLLAPLFVPTPPEMPRTTTGADMLRLLRAAAEASDGVRSAA